MIKINPTKIHVTSMDINSLNISWEVSDFSEAVEQYSFYVLRSEGPEGPYDVLAGPLQDVYHILDNTVDNRRRNRIWYYRIRVENTQTGETAEYPSSGGAYQTYRPTLAALEVARQFNLQLRKAGSGRFVLLFPRRTYGQTCGCVDSVTGQKRISRCSTCYTTGYVGGFHKPIPVYARIGPIPTRMYKQHQLVTSLQIANFPRIQPDWIMVDSLNRRWRISKDIRNIEVGGYVVRQEAGLDTIPRSDIEYNLPVLGVDELLKNPVPEWLFVNAYSAGEDHSTRTERVSQHVYE